MATVVSFRPTDAESTRSPRPTGASERSSHTWFVLQELLGQKSVKNYDGSWTEYGSLVGVPVVLGDEPGQP